MQNDTFSFENERRLNNLSKYLIPLIFLILFLLFLIFKSSVTINSGEAGVIYRTFGGGVDTEKTLDEGFHIIAPWNNVIKYEVRQQEIFEEMSVLSANGLEIKLDVSTWYQPSFENLGLLHKQKGENYLNRVIIPSIRSATRSVVGRYTPEEIYSSKRDILQDEVFAEAKEILSDQYVQINNVLVRDITLPPTIKEAIERKLRQEQESLEYEFRLTKAEKEAERQRIEAQGKADANRILSKSLTDKILQDKGIDATRKIADSDNSKVIVIGSGDSGLPVILGNQ